MKLKLFLSACALSILTFSTNSVANDETEAGFRELYKELVETNTTYSSGNCTLAAQRMADRLSAAGMDKADLNVFEHKQFPKEGGLVAKFKGSDPSKKPILLLAHIDVVEAKREDWVRDPFTLIEENGYFYARGAIDDKAMAAIFTDMMVNWKKQGFVPKRDVKLALTCGEETSGAFNGAKWLAENHKDWIDAEFAINEGAGGSLDANGNRVSLNVQAGEKVYQDFTLIATNPGGHSSQPVPKNAIYEMSSALKAVSNLKFPIQLNDANLEYFTRSAKIQKGEIAWAMQSIVKNPNDKKAESILIKNKGWNSMLRTTCVATMIEGGHAKNALPQSVKANVNCRMFPGTKSEEVKAALENAINDKNISVSINEPRSPATPTPKLPPKILAPIEDIAKRIFPGTPVIPVLTTGATDAIYTNAAGIPTYGFSGIFVDPDGGGIHGLNERVRVKSLMDARKFQNELIKFYSNN